MSLDASSLPTDSLYKMLTVGGLVLVVGGIALMWKSIDESQTTQLAVSEAEGALSNAIVAPQLDYKTICNRHKELEDEIRLVMSGVNVKALKEFKGGQPSDFPTLGGSLTSMLKRNTSAGVEWGIVPPPDLADTKSVKDWIRVCSAIREYKKEAASFLTAPNLEIVGPELSERALKEINDIQSMVSELEKKAIALSVPHQALESAKSRHTLAEKRQVVILGSGLILFSLGCFVFARASKNWYEQVQRFDDAILQNQAKDLAVGKAVSLLWEVGKFFFAVAIGVCATIVWLRLIAAN